MSEVAGCVSCSRVLTSEDRHWPQHLEVRVAQLGGSRWPGRESGHDWVEASTTLTTGTGESGYLAQALLHHQPPTLGMVSCQYKHQHSNRRPGEDKKTWIDMHRQIDILCILARKKLTKRLQETVYFYPTSSQYPSHQAWVAWTTVSWVK